MDAQAGMLARLFEHSMGLGPEWRVEDVWFESPDSGDEELHVRVGRTPGSAVPCPECGAPIVVVETARGPWRICVNMECPSKEKKTTSRGRGAAGSKASAAKKTTAKKTTAKKATTKKSAEKKSAE